MRQQRFRAEWISASGSLGLLPPPLWGRAGEGGRCCCVRCLRQLLPPPPPPPPPPPRALPPPATAGCGLARFRQDQSDQPRQAGVGWGGERTECAATVLRRADRDMH